MSDIPELTVKKGRGRPRSQDRKEKIKEYERAYQKQRYATDPEYRARKLERARLRRERLKVA